MKKIKYILLLFSITLLLLSCRDGVQMNQPVGNYLQIGLNLPEGGSSDEANRAIHADSTVLVVSLTYPGKEPIVAEFPFSAQSSLNVFVDQLTPANDVVVDVSLGLTAALPLTQSSTTMDIKAGGNSVNLTLAYNTYTVQGTLVDTSGNAVANQVMDIDGTSYTTDASGKFTLVLSTENWTDYTKFYMVDQSSNKLEFARTKRTLIENRTSFKLTAKPELYVDMNIKSDSFPLKGAYVLVDNGETYNFVPVYANSSGQIKYGPVDWTGLNEPLTVRVGFNGVFAEYRYDTKGAPGAVVGSVTLQPNVIFSSYDSATIYNDALFRLDYDSTVNKNEDGTVFVISNYSMLDGMPIQIVPLVSANATNYNYYNAVNSFCDYATGQIYLVASYTDISYYNRHIILKLNGWDVDYSGDFASEPLWTMGDVTFKEIPADVFESNAAYQYGYSVQQMVMLKGGDKILAVTSNGAFTFDTDTLAVDQVWSTGDMSTSILTLTGGYEDADGNLIVSGGISSGDADIYQSLWRLGTSGYSEIGSFSGIYNLYYLTTAGGSLTGGYPLGSDKFGTLQGLFPWNDSMMTVFTTDNNNTSTGPIVYAASWNSAGTVLSSTNSVSDLTNYEYIIPLGILPNNKFYLVNVANSDNTNDVLRMDKPGDSTLSIKTFLSNPSGNNYPYYYFENPFTAY